MTLPQLRDHNPHIAPVSRPPNEWLILVVDDDERIVEAFTTMLELEGYHVVQAYDGAEANRLIGEVEPDLILLDINLPVINGIDLCRKIKSDDSSRLLPVILVTGTKARDQRLEGLAAGADDFLPEPPDMAELTVRVRNLLRVKHLYEELEAHKRELEVRVEQRTAELRNAYERLQALSKVKDNVLTLMSHELRTPLHQANLALEMALTTDGDPKQQDDLLTAAYGAFKRLRARIDDVRVLSEPTEIKPSTAAIGDLLTRACEDATTRDERYHTAAIEVDTPGDISPVFVTPSTMIRALAHLIQNAIKFSDGKPVMIMAREDANMVEIAVQDQGSGISDEAIATAFEPLETGDPSSTRNHEGLGLGLPLVRLVIDAHGGEISITRPPSGGTCVTVRLPKADIIADG